VPAVLLLALLGPVPLAAPDGWQTLSFRGIPPNRVGFGPGGLTIMVDKSAGPVVWPLDRPVKVRTLRVGGSLTGAVRTTPERQGQKGADDFALRVGLVEAGTRRPGIVERRFAPEWVRRLFALAPPGQGVGQIRFFNLGLAESQIGWQRTHPLSDLLSESVVAVPDAAGRFDFTAEASGATVLALWLSADGDDTDSSFTVQVTTVELAP